MLDDVSFYLLLLGVMCLGFAWIGPKGAKGRNEPIEHDGRNWLYEKEVRELVNIMSGMKQDFEKQVHFLSGKVEWLEAELAQLKTNGMDHPRVNSGDSQDWLLLDNRYKEIFELKEKGVAHEDIAKRLDMGIGEVELIVQLHHAMKNRKQAGSEREQHG